MRQRKKNQQEPHVCTNAIMPLEIGKKSTGKVKREAIGKQIGGVREAG